MQEPTLRFGKLFSVMVCYPIATRSAVDEHSATRTGANRKPVIPPIRVATWTPAALGRLRYNSLDSKLISLGVTVDPPFTQYLVGRRNEPPFPQSDPTASCACCYQFHHGITGREA